MSDLKKQSSLFSFFSQISSANKNVSGGESQNNNNKVTSQENQEEGNNFDYLKRAGKASDVPVRRDIQKSKGVTANKDDDNDFLDEDSEDVQVKTGKKNKKLMYEESDEEEYEPKNNIGSKKKLSKISSGEEDYDDIVDFEDEIEEEPQKNKKAKGKPSGNKTKEANPKGKRKTVNLSAEEGQIGVGQIENSNMIPGKKVDDKGNVNYDMFDDPTPWWAQKEHRLDAQKRKPADPEFDPTTLYIPPEEINKLTPAKKQFWIIKSKNYDKVIFFKLGKFYELFDMDAVLGVQVLGLAFMGNTMHAGVPEASLDKYAEKLVQYGYKVGIVEQTETERERKTRLSVSGSKGQEKVIKRDMTRVLTKGTYISPLDNSPKINSNYIWVIKSHSESYAICISELSLNLCWVGHIHKDENYSQLKMLIYQLKPTEIVCDYMYLNRDIQKIFSNISNNPVITKISNSEKTGFWNNLVMNEVFKDSVFIKNLEAVVSEFPDDCSRERVRSVFTGFVHYLNDLKILDLHIDILSIRRYEETTSFKQRMVLDSQALEQLEIIEATHDFRTKRDDSLLHSLDRCASLPGKRLLKSLICGPYMDISIINERLDALEDLKTNIIFLRNFQDLLKKLGDLERTLAKLFKFSVRQKKRVVMFEDISTTRLRELKAVFENMSLLQDCLVNSNYSFEWKSKLMKMYTSTEDEGGLLKKNVKEEIEDIQSNILWTGESRNIPVPREGINPEYDTVKQQIKAVERELEAYLQDQKRLLKIDDIEFAHSKARYEISVPEKVQVPNNYSFSSSKKGYKRYTTEKTMGFVDKLEAKEDQLKEYMKEFALYIFDYFNRKRSLWENLVNIGKEIDVLCSLTIYSFHSRGEFCRPKLFGEDHASFIELKASRHPIISRLSEDFVPNDIRLGSRSGDHVILLTGPNMGGKSTVLRQVCLSCIIAQLGCYVPAVSCEMTVVDRIFTRLGANDRLVEGKSTFFIEMEDIYNLVSFGTNRSLAIIDELGRGTSTADGYAIAASILDYMTKSLGCLSIFSTHYHSLINFCLEYNEISFWKMDYQLDEESHSIVFLYKLVEGICNRSFGIKIGRLAGIQESILARAEQISKQIDRNLNKNFRDEIDKKFEVIKNALLNGDELTKTNF